MSGQGPFGFVIQQLLVQPHGTGRGVGVGVGVGDDTIMIGGTVLHKYLGSKIVISVYSIPTI